MRALITALLFILPGPFVGAAQQSLKPPQSFSQAKRIARQIYQDHPTSFYCNCAITWNGRKGTPDLKTCQYKVRKQQKRANRIEWEHLVPASQLGNQLQCWQNGGRKNCVKTSAKFRKMEADLHNLVPAIGEVNGDRSNYNFSEWNGKATQYGQCQMIADFKQRQVQPPEHTRGMISRTYQYMAEVYHLTLSSQQQKLLRAWDIMYPPSQWECHRNEKITQQTGSYNHHTKARCANP